MEITTRRRRALATVLALFLAVESVSAVAAAAVVANGPDTGPATAPGLQSSGVGNPAGSAVDIASVRIAPQAARSVMEVPDAPTLRQASDNRVVAAPVPARPPRIAARPLKAPVSKSSSGSAKSSPTTTGGTQSAGPRSYKGRNHVWIPSLGISRSVSWFSCDRSRAPDNYVYRWGCAGANNVYLLGHAWGVFRPLHDAYVGGRLRVGMKAYYADAKGRTHMYSVRWWKLTKPTTAASWAWTAQSVPSMTLQTCVGARSEYRLMVRLVVVDE